MNGLRDACFPGKELQEKGGLGLQGLKVSLNLIPLWNSHLLQRWHCLPSLLGRMSIIRATGLADPIPRWWRGSHLGRPMSASVVAVPRMILATFNASVLELALITESAAQGAIEERTAASA